MTRRFICAVLALGFAAAGAARAQDAGPADSVVWKKVHASVFGNAKLEAADAVVTLDTPRRAEDAAIVPLSIRAQFPNKPLAAVERILDNSDWAPSKRPSHSFLTALRIFV